MNAVAVNGLESQATKLLDFKDKIDVNLLDKVVASLYAGEGPQVDNPLFRITPSSKLCNVERYFLNIWISYF